MRHLLAAVLTVVTLFPGVASARGHRRAARALHTAPAMPRLPAGETRFLGKDPHGPLALVRRGVLRSPAEGACRTWARKGEVWQSIGRLGQVVGRARIVGMERYDVTNCDESCLEVTAGGSGASIFVAGDYEPLAIAPWSPTARQERALRELVAARDARLPKTRPGEQDRDELPLEKRMIGYRTPDGARRAVIGGRGISILRLEAGRWVLEHEGRPDKGEKPAPDRFVPIAVLDMDGDGVPEIVAHEDQYESFSDVTFHWKAGKWQKVEAGIHGSTA